MLKSFTMSDEMLASLEDAIEQAGTGNETPGRRGMVGGRTRKPWTRSSAISEAILIPRSVVSGWMRPLVFWSLTTFLFRDSTGRSALLGLFP